MENKKTKLIAIALLGIITFLLTFFFLNKGINNYEKKEIDYEEIDNIDYKVYLKENNFFENDYLPKDQIYITTLIDYIDIDFKHNIKYNELINGNYKYQIKGIISATQTNNENNNYWQKEYILTKEKSINYENKQNYTIEENIKIDYDYYNDILLDFKKTYNLSMDATLKIILYVENTIDSKNIKNGIKKDSILALTIPLTKATIEVPIKIDTTSAKSKISNGIIYDNEIISTSYKILSISSFIVSAISFIYIGLYYVKHKEKQSKIKKELKKILKTYDSIIVNAKGKIDITNLNLIEVSEFNELIDAYNELRQPIIYARQNEKAMFVLINNETALHYTIKLKE